MNLWPYEGHVFFSMYNRYNVEHSQVLNDNLTCHSNFSRFMSTTAGSFATTMELEDPKPPPKKKN